MMQRRGENRGPRGSFDGDDYGRDGISFGLIVSAGLLAVILVAGVYVFVSGDDPDKPAASGDGHPARAMVSGATGFTSPETDIFGRRVDIPNNPAGQPLPQNPGDRHKPADPDWLTAAPTGTKDPGGWQRVYGVSVPFSTSDGPARLENGQAVGYSHTPQGAALAAAQIMYRMSARPADRDLYVSQLRVPPKQLEEFDKAVAARQLPQQQPETVTRFLVASDAFQIESYADDMAIVRLAARGPVTDGKRTWAAVRLIMVWDAADWRLKPATSNAPSTEYITSVEGWTQW